MPYQKKSKLPTRTSLFEKAAKLMHERFDEILNSIPHNLEKGQAIEEIVKKFLQEYIPKRYSVTSGFVIDTNDNISSQEDVIIYDAFNCPIYRPGERTAIIPIDNVASLLEVKSELNTSNLAESLQKIHHVRKLQKSPPSSSYFSHPAELSHTYCVIFAFKSKVSIQTIFDIWKKQIKDDNTDIFHSCALIVIPDTGIFTTIVDIPGEGTAPSDLGGAPPAPPRTKVGVTYLETKEKTLDTMMRLLVGHLTFFWHRVHHPGFNFKQFGNSRVDWFVTNQ